MAREPKTAKSESLTIRLDPKTRFILEYVSRARGQTITTVVERAILESANNVKLENEFYDWKDFWDVSEGVRTLKVASQPELYPTFEEEQLLAFVRSHEDFFYIDRKNHLFRKAVIDIIWPKIYEFLEYWNSNRSIDYFGAGKKMAEAVRSAGVAPPVWPPDSAKQSSRMNDIMDDDIPF